MGGADRGKIRLRDVNHLVDAPAWGVSLQVPKAIGRTGVKTDAAVDAAGEVFVRRILAGDRRRSRHFGLRETVARRDTGGVATFG